MFPVWAGRALVAFLEAFLECPSPRCLQWYLFEVSRASARRCLKIGRCRPWTSDPCPLVHCSAVGLICWPEKGFEIVTSGEGLGRTAFGMKLTGSPSYRSDGRRLSTVRNSKAFAQHAYLTLSSDPTHIHCPALTASWPVTAWILPQAVSNWQHL